ncbi:MAG: GNAT family N-acetyltransferase, partial [bacterium]
MERIETERTILYPAAREEMEALIAAAPEVELKEAYAEMLEGCLRHPDRWAWYAAWLLERKDGTRIG